MSHVSPPPRPVSDPRARLSVRAEQARRELGRTTISRWVSQCLTVLFLSTLAAVPLMQALHLVRDAELSIGSPFDEIEPIESLGGGPAGTLRALQREIDRFEMRLEDESLLRRALVPPVQQFAVRWGLGNEKALVGRNGWLHYRADVEYVTGRGFLEPNVLSQRRAGGDAWQPAPVPDPTPALVELESMLSTLGIELLLIPVPSKATIHPETYTRRRTEKRPLHNRSYSDLKARLEEAGVELLDPSEHLLERKLDSGQPQFLATDTHWTGEAVASVAREIASWIEARPLLSPRRSVGRVGRKGVGQIGRKVVVENRGDIAAMLELPPESTLYPQEATSTTRVLTLDGRSWRPDPRAEVLVVGDSFTNIYSEPQLGWGSGAGLAETLSLALDRPVDRFARNQGGALENRLELARRAAGGELAGKKLVVYQFSSRDLTQGDWRLVASRSPQRQGPK